VDRLVNLWLDAWLDSQDRRPIVLRGARQVGKTWLVRDLARRARRELVEVNLERDPAFRR
jgi:predicted AAA+ superfamily ATPase